MGMISREAALDAIDKNRQDLLSLGMDGAEHILVHYGRRVIEGLPTIDPVPQLKWERDTAIEQLRQLGYGLGENAKRGKWVKLDMHPHLADHKCTACGESAYVPTCMGEPMYLFCPNCGALMRGNGGAG